MSGVDVRDLAKEKLPQGKFPVDPRADFRLFIAPEVHRGIDEHAKADVTVEICGVLVGNWGRDDNGPFAEVTDYIRCANAASKFAEVTFTHESWAQINKEMDSRFADKRIIGWYHSHPDFGIFLSERDSFIQEHFFSGAGQVAYVVDPVRDLEGVFEWRGGKPKPMPHFWIGNKVCTVEATERSAGPMTKSTDSVGASTSESAGAGASSLGFLTMLLGGLSLLMLGFLFGGWRVRTIEAQERQNSVARFADINLLQGQMALEMGQLGQRLLVINQAIGELPRFEEKPTDEELEVLAKRHKALQQLLKEGVRDLTRIEALSRAERDVYHRVIDFKMDELFRMNEAAREQERIAQEKAAEAKKKAASAGASSNGKAPASTNSKPPAGPQVPKPQTSSPPVTPSDSAARSSTPAESPSE